MTANVWTESAIATIAQLVHARTGLVFPPNRQGAAEAVIRRAMERVGLTDLERYRSVLTEGGAVLDDLVAELTVGETYFFREPRQLDFIEREVFPALTHMLGAGQAIRVWSAGCASGEEPYTLAIMMRAAGLAERARIVGTEISRPRLVAARQARYRKWSLRGVPEEVVKRNFEQRGQQFVLDPEIRNMVEFRYLNLAEDQYPASSTGIWGMHLILCRNVLIYFDADTIKLVAQRLLDSLGEGGWLFLGASDPPLTNLVPCEVVTTGAGLAYRRASGAAGPRGSGTVTAHFRTAGSHATAPGARAPGAPPPYRPSAAPLAGPTPTASQPPAPGEQSPGSAPGAPLRAADSSAGGAPGAQRSDEVEAPLPRRPAAHPPADRPAKLGGGHPPRQEIAVAYAERDYARVVELTQRELARDGNDPALWAMLVRALANAGRLAEAGVTCATALDRHRTSAELLYLHSLLLAEAGRPGDAAAAARRALYLDRNMIVAYLALGAALARLGDAEGARRAFSNADDLLARMPPEEIVPASDGESAFRLAQIARAQRSLLAGVVA